MKWINSANRSGGMTLVEVVAGLALMATLMASLLAVKTRVMHQSHLAERRHEALVAADQLLSQWWRNPKTFPRSATGSMPSGLAWRTKIVPSLTAAAAGGQVVRLDVFDNNGADAAVELLLPTWGQ